MDSHVEYDPEYQEELNAKVEKPKGKSAVERVRLWRKNNPDRYRAYQREYMKRYKKKTT